ncbi:Integral membrane protein [Pleurostoma richardsiae]|uniref:Integral membrane protein n=1 Tax=Pleurostoma richardsiae TaxID=41990 RepID=A0AA38VKE2_9PEZI|nr:Integral membrane protein [Pleurostoma richardsiae]
MGLNSYLNRCTVAMSQSWLLGNTAIQYYSACCGAASGIFFILAFIIADFIPPVKPSWDAEKTAHFYQDHIDRIRAGAAILMIAGGFYLPFSAAISYQIRRVPNVPYLIHQVQLASAAAGIWTFMLPGIVLAITSFRPYRPVEITQALNDFFWIVALMPWPTFMVQNFAFAYAIIIDSRKKPLFPKELSIVNIIMPIIFSFATGIHTVYHGPFAWNGVITFYIVGFTFVVQLIIDAVYLALAAREEERSGDANKHADYSANLEASSA